MLWILVRKLAILLSVELNRYILVAVELQDVQKI